MRAWRFQQPDRVGGPLFYPLLPILGKIEDRFDLRGIEPKQCGHAFLRGRAYVIPEDVKAVAPDVLRHRLVLTYEAEADEVTADAVVKRVLDRVPVP